MSTVFSDDDLLPISALQHLVFCERQCALIHIEQVWQDNRLTVQGRLMHEKTEVSHKATRAGVRVEYGMLLRSLKLGLAGKADIIEFHPQPDGSRKPFPVEYKLGKPKTDRSDEVQICAQALCLEEMLGAKVESGAMFYGRIRRRAEVIFDEPLRGETENAAKRLRELA